MIIYRFNSQTLSELTENPAAILCHLLLLPNQIEPLQLLLNPNPARNRAAGTLLILFDTDYTCWLIKFSRSLAATIPITPVAIIGSNYHHIFISFSFRMKVLALGQSFQFLPQFILFINKLAVFIAYISSSQERSLAPNTVSNSSTVLIRTKRKSKLIRIRFTIYSRHFSEGLNTYIF